MSESRAHDKKGSARDPRGKAKADIGDTLPDISMEDTDAAAQMIPDPGESFSAAPTLAPESHAEVPDFAELGEVDADSYVFGPEIARGGMGRILSARDRRTGRSVAIKEVLPELIAGLSEADKDGLVARFQREARVTALLQHPAIVPVYEIGNFKGRPFFAMKKVDGQGLDTLISERPTLDERLALLPTIVSVADALAYAHDQQVVHRDLKSSNILVGAFGETVVIDWGLAKSLADQSSETPLTAHTPSFDSINPLKTVAGAIFGTPHFMPPEQARGDIVDERADVYAIGSILYHLLSGQAPYQDSQLSPQSGSLLQQLRNEAPTPLLELAPEAPRDLLSIVEKAMSRKKAERYPSAGELAADLANFAAGQRVGVHRYSTSELVRRWLRRYRAAVATAAVLFTALLVTALLSFLSVVENRDQAQAAATLAQSETKRADQSTEEAMEFLAERGRIDLLEDRPVHALILLSKAFEHLPDRPAVQMLVAAAMRSIDALQWSFERHSSAVATLTISPDASKLATSDADGELRLWDLGSGGLLYKVKPGPTMSTSIPTFSSDGSTLLVGGAKGATIWDVESGEMIQAIAGRFTYLKYDHRDRMVSIDSTGQVAVWAKGNRTKTVLYQVAPHAPFWTARMTEDRKKLLVSLNRVYIVDLENDVTKTKVFRENMSMLAVDVCQDSQRALAADGVGKVQLWDLNSHDVLSEIKLSDPSKLGRHFVLGPKCQMVAALEGDRSVEIHDLRSGELISSIDASDSGIAHVVFSPDGSLLASLGRDEVVRLYEVTSGRWKAAFVGHSRLNGAALFLPSGKSLLVGDTAGKLRKWDTSTDHILRSLKGETTAAAIDPTGQRAVVIGATSVLLLDAKTLSLVAKIATPRLLYVTRFSRDGSRLLIGNKVYSSKDGALIRSFDVDVSGHLMVGISGNGQVVGISTATELRVWNVDTGALLYQSEGDRTMPFPLWISNDGDYVFSFLPSFRMARIDLTSGTTSDHLGNLALNRHLFTFLKDPSKVLMSRAKIGLVVLDAKTGEHGHKLDGLFRSIAVAHDGRRVLAVSDTSATFWNSTTGEVESTIKFTIPRYFYAAAISRDNSIIALATLNSVSVFDRVRGRLLMEVSLGNDVLHELTFDPSDKSLLVSGKGRVSVIDIHRETRLPATIQARVRERVGRVLSKGNFQPTQLSNSPSFGAQSITITSEEQLQAPSE